ncbi:MAG TPA: tetratricopeptide repeat protein [Bacteroidia bacterium]|jgi:serine phosphatase RsbU (regulator of sigma subunit)
MKRIVYLLFFLCSFEGMSQVNIDSLWRVWNNTANPDTNRLQAMQRICIGAYLYSQPDSAKILAQEMLSLSEKKNLKKYSISALNIMGASSSLQADNVRGIDYFRRSLKIAEEINDLKSMASCINNIGVIYFEMGSYEKALEYYSKGLVLNEKMNNRSAISLSLGNLGNVYKSLYQFDKALEYHTKALKISEEIGDQDGIGNALHSMGAAYLELGNTEKALDYSMRAVKVYEAIDDQKGVVDAMINIGMAYEKLNDIPKATSYFKKVLEFSEAGGFVSITREASLSLYGIYKKAGKNEDALKMHELYITMRDSIKNEEGQREVMKQEMEYNYEKQKALDEKEHEKKLAVAAEQEKKQKITTYAITAGLLLVLLFALFVVNRLRLTKKQKEIIEQQKNLAEEKQKEIVDSINYAKRLQEAILPPEHFVKAHLPDSFIFYKPKDIVAGDFYWMELLPDKTILLAAADCTGHGVPGAMVSVVCSNALNRAVLEFGKTEPGEILDKTRELVLNTFSKSDKEVKDGMDISLVSINKTTGELKWSGANSPLWYTSNGEMKEIKPDKQAIGKTDNPLPFKTHRLQLQKGDSVFMLTDGFADQFGGDKGKKFKYKPLKEMLLQNASLPKDQQLAHIETAFENWRNNLEQVDDLCIIGLRM